MGVPGSVNNLLGAGGAPQYKIERSIRLNAPDSAYLSRSFSAGNRKTWTWSGWVKRGALDTDQNLFGTNSSTGLYFQFQNNNTFKVLDYTGSTSNYRLETTQVFRDVGAWMHILFALDTTLAAADDRIKLYVNGTQITAFSTRVNPSPSYDGVVNSATTHTIGRLDAQWYLDAYLADIWFLDGIAATPSDFATTDATTGQWVPKRYTGSTSGTNTFHLEFADNSSNTATTLGKDTANSNNWTPSTTISVTAGAGNDSLVDTPTSYGTDAQNGGEVRGNYCTLNPIDNPSAVVLANGNLDHSFSTTSFKSVRATQMMSSGKWYFEMLYQAAGGMLGIARPSDDVSSHLGAVSNAGIGFSSTVIYKDGGSTGTSVSFNVGDILGCAFDADAGKVWFSRNGTWVNSGNPAAGTNAIFSSLTDKTWMPAVTSYNNGGAPHSINFGQRAFAYTAPSGFKALCDTNLPAPTIAKPNTVMDVKLYSGNSSTQNITGLNFNPDFVWIKCRSTTYQHALFDAVRGVTKHLTSNNTDAEYTESAGNGLASFNSDGFSLSGELAVGTGNINTSSQTYAAWCWDAGTTTDPNNTAGSITSSVRANTTAGFSIVTWTGNGSTSTIGHGGLVNLDKGLIIVKSRSTTGNWMVGHGALGWTKGFEGLNTTNAANTASSYWNDTAPTSTVFTVSGADANMNGNGRSQLAYCFAPVANFSAMGSYTGNGSTDGPFVYTGFRPRWIMIKRTDAAYGWYMYDTARDTYNIAGKEILANESSAEVSDSDLDILSNGFKPRRSSLAFNASGGTFVYASFAEFPFVYARAR